MDSIWDASSREVIASSLRFSLQRIVGNLAGLVESCNQSVARALGKPENIGGEERPLKNWLARSRVWTIMLCALSGSLHAQQNPPVDHGSPRAQSAVGRWGDQHDGSFLNPVLPGDFSDLDAIRVDDDFYAISSTMQYSPGMVILRSRDLVDWQIVGHVVSNMTALDPELGWDRMNRDGRGIWAGSIRYHLGRFWVYFGTPDGGIYMASAIRPDGPWSAPKLVIDAAGWDDPCPFWDDDGKGYLVTTRFSADEDGQKYRIHLFALNARNDGVIATTDRILYQSHGSEANKLYKIDGVYLHYFSEVKAEGRVAMMERSKSLSGPWEVRQLNHVHGIVDKDPNQGGLIQLKDGNWWFLSHQVEVTGRAVPVSCFP
jgi:beta-xylosidase